MKRISYWIRNYFGFSQKEASGFIVLVILILIFLLLPSAYKSLSSSEHNNYALDKHMLDSLIRGMDKNIKKDSSHFIEEKRVTVKLSDFNPNDVSKNEMLSLGFENRMAERIINYRKKGGLFRIKKDLLKIYGFPDALFLKLQSYIVLPDSLPRKNKPTNTRTLVALVFDINQSDTIQLNFLKGIGSVMSGRIIKYRNALGGYISKEQFKEVYGLSPLALDELNQHTFIANDFIPERININTAGKEALAKHPYLRNKMAAIIINYRQQHGPFKSVNDLKEIKSISADEVNKLVPYLNF